MQRTDITQEHVIELRKTYPRSHEPWSNEETDLYHKLVSKTNDIEFLCSIFQRSPNSIKAAYEQKIKKTIE